MGTYKVTLIVSSSTNTKDTFTKTVKTEYPRPAVVPSFTITSATEKNPGDPSVITFQNTSNGEDGVRYEWDFGDGQFSQDNSRNPIKHKYEATKRYTVTLTAMNSYGATSSTKDSATAFVLKTIKIEKVVLTSMPKKRDGGGVYDFFSDPDPFFTIGIPSGDKIVKVYKSPTVDNSFLGEWAIDFTFGIAQSIQLEFRDDDDSSTYNDFIGRVNCADGQSMLNQYPNKSFRFENTNFPSNRQGVLSVDLIVTYMP